MHRVDIKVFCIAQTRMNESGVESWLEHIGVEDPSPPITKDIILDCPQCRGQGVGPDDATCKYCDGDKTDTLEQEVTDAGAVCGLCAKRCYMSFEAGLNPNVTRVRKVWHEYLENILKSGHGSVIEHATWTFAIEGVSRVFTGELNRHRAGVAISEGSMRYIRFDDIGYWEPSSIQPGNQILWSKKLGLTEEEFEQRKGMTRQVFSEMFFRMETVYKSLCMIWDIENMKAFSTKKKLTSMFRRLIGMGVATGGTWTFNARALRHILALRTSPHAEEEIAMVMSKIGKYIVEQEPALFGDFTVDEATGAYVPVNKKI